MWKEIKAGILNSPEWFFKGDIGICEEQKVNVGESFEGGWLVGIKDSPGRYNLLPLSNDKYRLEEGVIKGEIKSNELTFEKKVQGWEDIKIRGIFLVEKPGVHSTSFRMYDPKGKEVVGRGYLYKRVIAN